MSLKYGMGEEEQGRLCTISDSSNERYSVIAAITDNNQELVAIRNGTTDQTIFCELINQLWDQIQAKYGQDKKRVILIADGAKYHWTEKVKNTIKEKVLMMIQTVTYRLEFSPVELFINWVKGHFRKLLRTGEYVWVISFEIDPFDVDW